MDDAYYMDLALVEAEDALKRGDWPVGAVLVKDDRVLSTGQNRQVSQGDITIHAETDAIRRALRSHGVDAVKGSVIYASTEPCPMCAWAIHLAGIERLVLGLRHATLNRTDMGTYSIESFQQLAGCRYQLTTGIRAAECLALRRRWAKDPVAR